MTPGAIPAGSGFAGLNADAPLLILPPRTPLITRGQRSRNVYYLISGIAKLVHWREDRGVPVGLRMSGSLLGATAALLSTEHRVAVETVTTCRVQCFGKQTFRRLLDTDPLFSRQVGRILSSELDAELGQIATLLGLPAKERLRHMLLDLASGQHSLVRQGAVKLALPIKLRELAELLGITPEHLSRLLNQLEREGLFCRDDKGWFVFRKAEAGDLAPASNSEPDYDSLTTLTVTPTETSR